MGHDIFLIMLLPALLGADPQHLVMSYPFWLLDQVVEDAVPLQDNLLTSVSVVTDCFLHVQFSFALMVFQVVALKLQRSAVT